MAQAAGVYLHFPYCDVKCAYCDFFSLKAGEVDDGFWQKYTARLSDDISKQLNLLPHDSFLASIFIGGGTPSKVPPAYIEKILEFIFNSPLPVSESVEITLESNPESIDSQKLAEYRSAGINRLSIGIQSRDEEVLRYLGRIISPDKYRAALPAAHRAGFKQINCDLITGVPGLSLARLQSDIDYLIDEGVTHISAYSLTVEEGTKLAIQIKNRQKPMPSERRQALHYNFMNEYLPSEGFERYEVSNFARSGCRCLHNLSGWRSRYYIGAGVSAHAYLPGRRLMQPRSLQKYLSGTGIKEEPAGSLADILIGGVRLNLWQNLKPYRQAATSAEFESFLRQLYKLEDEEKIEIRGERFRFKPAAIDFADSNLKALAIF